MRCPHARPTLGRRATAGRSFPPLLGRSAVSCALPRQNGQSVRVTSTQRGNVELIRRALDSDPDALADNIVWHFQSPHPELVTHFEGKDEVLQDWPRMLDDLTDGTFNKRAVDIWPVGEDLVVAHFEIEMTIGDVRHQGSSVVVYRLADGVIIEGFDIPSLSLLTSSG
jgi:uncharacterized protein